MPEKEPRHFDLDFVLSSTVELSEDSLEWIVGYVASGGPADNTSPYTGESGIAYAFARVGRLDLAMPRVRVALSHLERRHSISFIDGTAGIHCVAALVHIYEIHARRVYKAGSRQMIPSDPTGPDSANRASALFHLEQYLSLARHYREAAAAEWLYGRCGYLTGIAMLQRAFASLPPSTTPILPISAALISDAWHLLLAETASASWAPLWHDSPYVGAAHGTVGIIHALLLFPELAAAAAQQILEGLAVVARWAVPHPASGTPTLPFQAPPRSSSSRPATATKPPRDGVCHFCHGAPGAVLLFAAAAKAFPHAKVPFLARWLASSSSSSSASSARPTPLIDIAIAFADTVWRVGALRKGPGLCHGVGGNGYVMLSLADTLADLAPARMAAAQPNPEGHPLAPGVPAESAGTLPAHYVWRRRALAFARLTVDPRFHRAARVPDNPLSLFEGLAGAAVLVHDVVRGVRAAFPLFELADPKDSVDAAFAMLPDAPTTAASEGASVGGGCGGDVRVREGGSVRVSSSGGGDGTVLGSDADRLSLARELSQSRRQSLQRESHSQPFVSHPSGASWGTSQQ